MPPAKQQDTTISIRDYFDVRLLAQEKKLDEVGSALTQLAKGIIGRDSFDKLCKDLEAIRIDLIKRLDELEDRVETIENDKRIEDGKKKVFFLFSDKIWAMVSVVLTAYIISKYI
jgi:tetrahydromethanopterin S-methyltransferase subunit G